MNPERIIKFLLILVGIVCAPAVFPACMPKSWMAATHEWMGLGKFPEQPVAEYLARGMSILCAFFGGLALLLSREVMRYLLLIRYQALFLCMISPVGMFLGLKAGLPAKYLVMDAAAAILTMLPVAILSFQLKLKTYPVHSGSVQGTMS